MNKIEEWVQANNITPVECWDGCNHSVDVHLRKIREDIERFFKDCGKKSPGEALKAALWSGLPNVVRYLVEKEGYRFDLKEDEECMGSIWVELIAGDLSPDEIVRYALPLLIKAGLTSDIKVGHNHANHVIWVSENEDMSIDEIANLTWTQCALQCPTCEDRKEYYTSLFNEF